MEVSPFLEKYNFNAEKKA